MFLILINGVPNFILKSKQIKKINYYIYIYIFFFFLRSGCSWEHLELHVAPPLSPLLENKIKLIFMTRAVPKYLNKTLITLIPKNRNLETLNNYHSISLCNTIYKMVTKIIVARIRPLLPNLISPL